MIAMRLPHLQISMMMPICHFNLWPMILAINWGSGAPTSKNRPPVYDSRGVDGDTQTKSHSRQPLATALRVRSMTSRFKSCRESKFMASIIVSDKPYYLSFNDTNSAGHQIKEIKMNEDNLYRFEMQAILLVMLKLTNEIRVTMPKDDVRLRDALLIIEDGICNFTDAMVEREKNKD